MGSLGKQSAGQTDKSFALWSLCGAGKGTWDPLGKGGRRGRRQISRAQGPEGTAQWKPPFSHSLSSKTAVRLPAHLGPLPASCARAGLLCTDGVFPIQLVRDKLCETPAIGHLLMPPGKARLRGGAGPSPPYPPLLPRPAWGPGAASMTMGHPTEVGGGAWMGLWVSRWDQCLANLPRGHWPPHPSPCLIYESMNTPPSFKH